MTRHDTTEGAETAGLSMFVDRQQETDAIAASAVGLIDRHPKEFLRFPFDALHRLVGAIPPGELWFWAGLSGHGKTTALMSIFDRWTTSDVPGMYIGLEMPRRDLYIHWACRRLGARDIALHPGHVLAGNLHKDSPDRIANADALIAELTAEIEHLRRTYAESARFAPVRYLNATNLPKLAQQAAVWGMKFLIVDHVEDFEMDDERNRSNMDAHRAMLRALDMARDRYGITIIGAAQMNTEQLRRPGGMVRAHQPPTLDMVSFGMEKRKVCDGMVASYKPLPDMPEDAALVKSYRSAMRMIRDDPQMVRRHLVADTMGVALMKDRKFGRDGDVCFLGVHNSRIVDANPYAMREAQERMARFGSEAAMYDEPAPRSAAVSQTDEVFPAPRRVGRPPARKPAQPSWFNN